jgi:hypothetical protein
MLLPPDPDRRTDPDRNPLNLISEIGCLLSLLSLLVCASAIFIYPSLFESDNPDRDAVRKITRFFHEQESSYKNTGKFIDRQSEISNNYLNLQSYNRVAEGNKLERIVVTTHSNHLTGNRRKVVLGFLEIIRAKRNKQSNTDRQNKTEIQWQYLDVRFFICSSNKRGVAVPDKTVLDRVSDRCPVGYSQSSSHTNVP